MHPPLTAGPALATRAATPATTGTDNDATALFIGPGHAAQRARWHTLARRGVSWNWLAFAGGAAWFAWRRMPCAAAAFVLASVLIQALAELIGLPPAQQLLALAAPGAVAGLLADRLYQQHVRASVATVLAQEGVRAVQESRLRAAGGTRPCAALACAALWLALLVACSLLSAEPLALP